MSRTIRFQFVPAAKERTRRAVMAQLMAGGAEDVEPLFPGEVDPELASLFSAHVADGGSVPSLMALLSADESVAFVEEDAPRRLIRPPGSSRKGGAKA